MYRRLHSAMVYSLVALLVTLSMAQRVFASPIALPLVQTNTHSSHDDAHHDHSQALHDGQSKLDCLKYCLENAPDQYLAPTWAESLAPKMLPSEPLELASARTAADVVATESGNTARGPPDEYWMPHTAVGVRGLLLLNARLRN